ncbi:MAG: putative 4-hydroxybenzoate polyprenyltransferase [Candidatus Obscuribacterales bacterium]|jgi:4-hydroxybenzoate polyprenyltransferase|nr:putative 4-hydroxybenzoate polyprenyltransferase [Candidatus Obscuribacterales bacterium]
MQKTDIDNAGEKAPLPSAPPDKPLGPFATIKEWAEMIKIEHTVFALPFALSGMILGAKSIPEPATWFWTILAFAGARSAAMTLNRLIDAGIDAANPRTSMRSIPAGKISPALALVFAIVSFGLMIFAASKLPPLCMMLSPIAVFWLSFYSFTKRFTWMCHIVLGIALGGAALGGWIAAGGSLAQYAPWLLATAVSTWVAGFDLIYALQDVEFDRDKKLHSIPARFGIEAALNVSAGLHLLTVCSLMLLGCSLDLGPIYYCGVTMVAIMLKYEHSLVKPNDLSKINAAFFNTNGIVSIATFVAVLLDKLIKF